MPLGYSGVPPLNLKGIFISAMSETFKQPPHVPEIKDRTGSGMLVETKHGIGRTFSKEQPINGKVTVFFEDGRKILFAPENLTLRGFID